MLIAEALIPNMRLLLDQIYVLLICDLHSTAGNKHFFEQASLPPCVLNIDGGSKNRTCTLIEYLLLKQARLPISPYRL